MAQENNAILNDLKQYIAPVEYHFVDMSEHKNLAVYFVVDRINERIIKPITLTEFDNLMKCNLFKQEDIKTDNIINAIKEYIRNNIFKPKL